MFFSGSPYAEWLIMSSNRRPFNAVPDSEDSAGDNLQDRASGPTVSMLMGTFGVSQFRPSDVTADNFSQADDGIDLPRIGRSFGWTETGGMPMYAPTTLSTRRRNLSNSSCARPLTPNASGAAFRNLPVGGLDIGTLGNAGSSKPCVETSSPRCEWSSNAWLGWILLLHHSTYDLTLCRLQRCATVAACWSGWRGEGL